ncbi:MAG: DUF86 domain-containing protein [bacterium]
MIKREYKDYINDIINAINDIAEFTKGQDQTGFSVDKKTSFAVVRGIEIIGEAAKNIPSDVKAKYPEIPWKELAGMRDKVIHGYFGVDLSVIWQTAKNDLPPLLPIFKTIS